MPGRLARKLRIRWARTALLCSALGLVMCGIVLSAAAGSATSVTDRSAVLSGRPPRTSARTAAGRATAPCSRTRASASAPSPPAASTAWRHGQRHQRSHSAAGPSRSGRRAALPTGTGHPPRACALLGRATVRASGALTLASDDDHSSVLPRARRSLRPGESSRRHRCRAIALADATAGDDPTLIEAPGAWPLVGSRGKAGDLRAAQTGQTRSGRLNFAAKATDRGARGNCRRRPPCVPSLVVA